MPNHLGPRPTPAGVFHTTRWSLVLAARENNGPQSEEALEQLCRTYSPALYAYLRRAGHGREDAQDLTQDFLSQLVQKDWLDRLQDQRGRFRSFLLTFLKHFLMDERRKNHTLKRGGGTHLISLEDCEAWEKESLVMDGLTPEQMFDRRWAQTMMARALDELRGWYAKQGQLVLFEQLRDLQPGEHGPSSHAEIAAGLGLDAAALNVAARRFRQRYGDYLRREVAQTVVDPQEVQAELRQLVEAFAR